MANAAGGRAGHVYRHALHGFQFHGSAQAAEALRHNPRVASVQPDTAVYLTDLLPRGVDRVAAWDQAGTDGAYQQGFRGNGARIAILDTGIDLDHPDLVGGIDAGLGTNCINDTLPPNDGHGHGSHVSGTAASPYNGVGMVGIAPEARLVPVKVFDDTGNSAESIILCGLDHIIGLNSDGDASNDVDVANMSFGEQRAWGDCSSDPLHGAICRAHGAGIILVGGAGNSAADAGSFVPAAYPEVIGVSAMADFDGAPGGLAGCPFVFEIFWFECDDSFALFSNYGPVDVIAPGVQEYSTWAGGGYQTSSGTSMAAPHITGIAALMAAAAPGISPDAALAALLASGECPNGTVADVDGLSGCAGQGSWPDDPDGIPEPMGHALRAAQYAAGNPPPPPAEPPSAPSLAGITREGAVDLSWTAPTDDGGAAVAEYEVYRGDSAGTATLLASGVVGLAYTDTAVAGGQTYWYQVAARNSAGLGARSNEVSATPPAPPPDPPSAPTLSASAGNGSVQLGWTVPTDDGGSPVTGYQIYRGGSSGTAIPLTSVGNVLTYTDSGLTNGSTYWYQVAAVNAADTGPRSNEASATPQHVATAPSAPLNLVGTAQKSGIRLTWSPPSSNGGSAVTDYRVLRGTVAGGESFLVELAGSQLAYTDSSVLRHTRYFYVVVAVNAINQGPRSNEVNVRSR